MSVIDIEREDGDFPVARILRAGKVRALIRYEQHVDENDSPRECCNVGVMLCAHSRYTLGDEQVGDEDWTAECPSCEGTGESPDRFELLRIRPYAHQVVGAGTRASMRSELLLLEGRNRGQALRVLPAECVRCEGLGSIHLSLPEYLRRERGARVILPLGLYDHSGLSMYVGRKHWQDAGGWDSGQVGVIFDTDDTRSETVGDDATDEQIREALVEEVELYDRYLRGEVFYIETLDADGDTIECVGGFLGWQNAEEEAEAMLRQAVRTAARERDEAAHWAQRDTVTA